MLCWRSELSHLTSPALLPCSTGPPSPAAPESLLARASLTTLVITPQVLTPNLPHHSKHPPQITGEIPKPSPVPLQLTWPLCSCPFYWEVPGTLSRNAFSSRKCQFIKTLLKKRSLQTNFFFQKPSGEKKKKKEKKKYIQHFSYPAPTALNEK